MINPSSTNAAAPDHEHLHNGHVDATHTEWDQATDGPTTQALGDSNATDVRPSPDPANSTSTVLDHGHADVFRVGSAPDGGIDLNSKKTSPAMGCSTPPKTSSSKSKIPLSLISLPTFLARLRDMSYR